MLSTFFEGLLRDNLHPALGRKFSESTLRVSDMCKYIILIENRPEFQTNSFERNEDLDCVGVPYGLSPCSKSSIVISKNDC